jgi:hypothetical protein
VVRHLLGRSKQRCDIEAYEIQADIQVFLKQSYERVAEFAKSLNKEETFGFTVKTDFLADAETILQEQYGNLSSAIQNPPYYKLPVSCYEPESPPESVMDIPADTLINNPNDIYILPADQKELDAFLLVSRYPHKWCDLDVQMSTGKVVAHRTEALNSNHEGAMYIEAKCMDSTFDKYAFKHSPRSQGNTLTLDDNSIKLTITAQPCVLIKRISSNSDGKRMHVNLGFH